MNDIKEPACDTDAPQDSLVGCGYALALSENEESLPPPPMILPPPSFHPIPDDLERISIQDDILKSREEAREANKAKEKEKCARLQAELDELREEKKSIDARYDAFEKSAVEGFLANTTPYEIAILKALTGIEIITVDALLNLPNVGEKHDEFTKEFAEVDREIKEKEAEINKCKKADSRKICYPCTYALQADKSSSIRSQQ